MQAITRLVILFAITLTVVGAINNNFWLELIGATIALTLSTWVIGRTVYPTLNQSLLPQQWRYIFACLGIAVASGGLFLMSPPGHRASVWFWQLDWQQVSTIGSVLGALGQIFIALLAVYIAWQQYVISEDLTIRSNTITQQQTIDAYFQGIAQLMLDDEGLLEDMPIEQAFAEGRTAAILSSIDASGKAKVLRFLSRSGLLTPLKRDKLLGRAILDGSGVYCEDRPQGVRVIDLGAMLAGVDLAGTDLRWTDLSEANLMQTNLPNADLVRANLSRAVLTGACLSGADLQGARLFYGHPAQATPRNRNNVPNYKTGAYTGAIVEDADFTDAKRLAPAQRYYCCAWGGSKTRATMPGGCEGIPNRLDR